MSPVKTNRPLRELVAEAKAEVMEEIEDDREEAEDDEPAEVTPVSRGSPLHLTPSLSSWISHSLLSCISMLISKGHQSLRDPLYWQYTQL